MPVMAKFTHSVYRCLQVVLEACVTVHVARQARLLMGTINGLSR
eukprot:SAG11_NODE_3056_length_2724_cov_4.133333_2_plen_44_part_00